MSNRTAQANKAVEAAWINEQQRVLAGKGTRDWNLRQQQDIIDRGKAYDDDGRAFQGHHMKSVEKYPEYQGNPDNIQFLSRAEHKQAHFGDYHIPTNGMYDPKSGETLAFPESELIPCDVIDLSDPVIVVKNPAESKPEHIASEKSYEASATARTIPKTSVKGNRIKSIINKTWKFYERHKSIINPIAKTVGSIAVGAVVDHVISRSGSHGGSYTGEGVSETIKSASVDSVTIDSPSGHHASPSEHMVSSHWQRYNGVWKEKAAYIRGGKE